ncbi:MAG: BrnT family toxin [Candidatus Pacebacteria bacterium]|nr:BrnT family toxin [Candidatus Paceibacterota bacterium]
MITLPNPIEFAWDDGNQDKNFLKHNVSTQEAEEVFFDPKRKIAKDFLHSKKEDRYLVIGKTSSGRKLFIVFTPRNKKIRIVSARDLNKREYVLLVK